MTELARAVELLRAGAVIGLPTETVYGLAADIAQPEAVRSVFSIKGRPSGHPLIVHLLDESWLGRYCTGELARARRLAQAFWPGPLTMILPRDPSQVSDLVTGGLDTVAVRVPGHPVALEVIRGLGRPVAAPSANRFGGVSPTTRQHVLADLGSDVPLVLDGGACGIGLESTIVDLSRERAYLLRPGYVTREQISEILGEPVLDDDGYGPAAPGTLESHYAPAARVVLSEASQVWELARALARRSKVGVLALLGTTPPADLDVELYEVRGGLEAAAHELYAGLRELDALGCEVIVSPVPALQGIGVALVDRLGRAAAPRSSSF